MHTTAVIVWATGLALQCSLLAILVVRRRVLRLPVFTILIGFYVVRSVTLWVLSTRMPSLPFAKLSEVLGLLDPLLQLAVVAEITVAAARQYGDAGRDRLFRALLFLLAGLLAAVFATIMLPSRGPAPIDRGAVLISFLMLLVWLWMAVERLGGPARRVVEGFGAYGAMAVASNLIHNHAGLHRNESLFRAASWAQSCVYLLVTAFWCVALRRASSAVAVSQPERVQA